MAASDPTPYVATPAGTLQGVAAFSWDGSAWQPSGRAGPSVATPTGVLQGVAPFSWSGSAWTPAGRAQPGVATPSGVLDGVAVYTWSGSAWTPASGTATPSTPSGALRGVAAFSWDGAAWQPAAQARASVPTPYGVLDGVAMFEWGGSSWQAGAAVPAGATLDLSFLSGTLNPLLTFTRGSTATYFDVTGTMQTAALNLLLWSADASNAAWTKAGVTAAAPTVTVDLAVAPDGTTTADRVVYPAVSGAGALSVMIQGVIATAAAYTFSVYLRGNAGGEQTYVYITDGGAAYPVKQRVTLTTAWQRFSVTATLTAASWYGGVGTDLRDGGQSSTSAGTMFAWGAQVELGAAATSYIPTTTAASGAPRFDYDPVTHAALGLLIEEQRTNVVLNSADASNASWVKTAGGGPAIPTVAGNLSVAPDGTTTAARVVYPTVSAAGTYSFLQPAGPTVTAAVYTLSVYAKGNVGGEQIYLYATPDAVTFYRTRITLTTAWQRFSLVTGTLTATTWFFAIGCDIRDGSQTAISAQTIFVWGAQLEQGAFPTSYIPTTAAAVTRSPDLCSIQPAQMGFYTPPGGSWAAEVIPAYFPGSFPRVVFLGPTVSAAAPVMFGGGAPSQAGQYDGTTILTTINTSPAGVVAKIATTATATVGSECLNGGAVASAALAGGGYPTLASNGVGFLCATGASPSNTVGYIRRVRYWPRVLSNAEMQQVTT